MSRQVSLHIRIMLIMVSLALIDVTATVQAAPQTILLFQDDMEHGVNGWTVAHASLDGGMCSSDEWHQIMTDSHSLTHSWSNDPYGQAVNGECLNYLTTPS